MNKNWFTRKHQEHVDPVYLSSMVKATEYFIGWFKGYYDTSYEKMLIQTHHIACADGYAGNTGGSSGHVDDKFRQFNIGSLVLKKEWYVGVGNDRVIHPGVKGIPGWMSHWVENLGCGYRLHLPDPDDIPYCVERLYIIMDSLKQKFNITLLSTYMHTFVMAHPFEKVNFSVCMAQVNAILDMNGYETLYHEYMDFMCFLYDSDTIEKMFVGRLSKKPDE